MCTNENYRGIALCSALCKLVDLIIIDTYKSKLVTSELQYAFKTGHSTNMCTPVLKEVCSYYKNGNQARTQGGGGRQGGLAPPPQKKKKPHKYEFVWLNSLRQHNSQARIQGGGGPRGPCPPTKSWICLWEHRWIPLKGIRPCPLWQTVIRLLLDM